MIREKDIINAFSACFGTKYKVYFSSLITDKTNWYFMAKDSEKKYLFILGNNEAAEKFKGPKEGVLQVSGYDLILKRSDLSFDNLKILQNIFLHLHPVKCGMRPSFGAGDRLGISTPAQISSFNNRRIFPFPCQQSVRELNKTKRSWQEVMTNAVWGLFEAGYKGSFGADADHVKEIDDLRLAIQNGFSMFTIDPSDFIISKSGKAEKNFITVKYNSIPGKKEIEKLYLGKKIRINKKLLEFDSDSLKFIIASYFEAIQHVINCYEFIKRNMKKPFDFEVSMDEIDEPITPLAHYFIISELKRHGVDVTNIALCYPGKWEKAIDYEGDIEEFTNELGLHAGIVKEFGEYKLSLHSGSEKTSVYKKFSEITNGLFHIKTSGTSWLESLRVVALKNAALFKKLYDYSVKRYQEEKKSYHISTSLASIPDISMFTEGQYGKILDLKECRQMLHIIFGSVLTAKDDGVPIFSDDIYKTLFINESLHYKYLEENISRHLDYLSI